MQKVIQAHLRLLHEIYNIPFNELLDIPLLTNKAGRCVNLRIDELRRDGPWRCGADVPQNAIDIALRIALQRFKQINVQGISSKSIGPDLYGAAIIGG